MSGIEEKKEQAKMILERCEPCRKGPFINAQQALAHYGTAAHKTRIEMNKRVGRNAIDEALYKLKKKHLRLPFEEGLKVMIDRRFSSRLKDETMQVAREVMAEMSDQERSVVEASDSRMWELLDRCRDEMLFRRSSLSEEDVKKADRELLLERLLVHMRPRFDREKLALLCSIVLAAMMEASGVESLDGMFARFQHERDFAAFDEDHDQYELFSTLSTFARDPENQVPDPTRNVLSSLPADLKITVLELAEDLVNAQATADDGDDDFCYTEAQHGIDGSEGVETEQDGHDDYCDEY
jgi:hypothetical protein